MNFKLRIFKSVGASNHWSNTYHFQMPDVESLPDASVLTAVDKIVAFEKTLHIADVNFIRATVNIVRAPGTAPVSTDFVSVPLAGVGSIAIPGEDHGQLPNELCLKVAFTPDTGRNGYVLYRRALLGGWWQNVGGEAVPTNATQNNFNAEAHPLFANVAFPQLILLPKGANEATVGRLIKDVKIQGIVGRQEHVKKAPKVPSAPERVMKEISDHIEALGALFGAAVGLKALGKWVLAGGPDAMVASWEALGPIAAGVFAL
jgi:hypothetical protein